MRSLKKIFSVCIFLLVALTSCKNQTEEKCRINCTIDDDYSRMIGEHTSNNIDWTKVSKIVLLYSSTDIISGELCTWEKDATNTAKYKMENDNSIYLNEGIYSFTLILKDSSGNTIITCKLQNKRIYAGNNTLSFDTSVINEITGTGNIELTFNWTADFSTSSIKCGLFSFDNISKSVSDYTNLNISNRTATYKVQGISCGNYFVKMQMLNSSGTVIYNYSDLIVVSNGDNKATINIGNNIQTHDKIMYDATLDTLDAVIKTVGQTGKSEEKYITVNANSNSDLSKIKTALNDNSNVNVNLIITGNITSIPEASFFGRTNLLSISVPETVTIISKQAFYGCSNLKSISGLENVKSISSEAFTNCTALERMSTLYKIESIYTNAFNSSKKLDLYIYSDVTKETVKTQFASLGNKLKSLNIHSHSEDYCTKTTIDAICTENSAIHWYCDICEKVVKITEGPSGTIHSYNSETKKCNYCNNSVKSEFVPITKDITCDSDSYFTIINDSSDYFTNATNITIGKTTYLCKEFSFKVNIYETKNKYFSGNCQKKDGNVLYYVRFTLDDNIIPFKGDTDERGKYFYSRNIETFSTDYYQLYPGEHILTVRVLYIDNNFSSFKVYLPPITY